MKNALAVGALSALLPSMVLAKTLMNPSIPASISDLRSIYPSHITDYCGTEALDFLIFNATQPDFLAIRQAATSSNPTPGACPSFSWASDKCTSVSEWVAGYDFTTACQRHDFGWANLPKARGADSTDGAGRPKADVDLNFDLNMHDICNAPPKDKVSLGPRNKPTDPKAYCHHTADAFFVAISLAPIGNDFGSKGLEIGVSRDPYYWRDPYKYITDYMHGTGKICVDGNKPGSCREKRTWDGGPVPQFRDRWPGFPAPPWTELVRGENVPLELDLFYCTGAQQGRICKTGWGDYRK